MRKCGCCGKEFQPRNFKRHVKACLSKKRAERAEQTKAFLKRINEIRGDNARAN